MPILKNARHEAFAQNIASGMSQEQAYINAGFSAKGARGSSTKLLQANSSLASRVAELRAVGALEAVVTAADLSAQLEDLRRKAVEAGQFGAAVQAVNGRAKLHGLIIDKAEVKDVTPPRIEEVDAKINAYLAKASENIRTNGASTQKSIN